jgi:hypothetical protein
VKLAAYLGGEGGRELPGRVQEDAPEFSDFAKVPLASAVRNRQNEFLKIAIDW